MANQNKEIAYFKTAEGKLPFRNWFHTLKDKRTQAKIDARLERVKQGNLGYCRSVGSGVMELKIDFGPGYRIYFGQSGNRLVILLTGGVKCSQRRDIKTAQAYWADYRRRYGSKPEKKYDLP